LIDLLKNLNFLIIFRVSRHSRGPGGKVPGTSVLGTANPEIRGFGGQPPNTDPTSGDSQTRECLRYDKKSKIKVKIEARKIKKTYSINTMVGFPKIKENSHSSLNPLFYDWKKRTRTSVFNRNDKTTT
jgi:hypothetical protein